MLATNSHTGGRAVPERWETTRKKIDGTRCSARLSQDLDPVFQSCRSVPQMRGRLTFSADREVSSTQG